MADTLIQLSTKVIWILFFCLLALYGCEDTNVRMATEAGMEVVQALTLSDQEIRELANSAAEHADKKHHIAPPENKYAQRLQRLIKGHLKEEGYNFFNS